MGSIMAFDDDGVKFHQLRIIDTPGGDVLRCLRTSDSGYSGFGEAYFSKVNKGIIKGWKKHLKMTLNLTVVVGEVKFVFFDDRKVQTNHENFQTIAMSPSKNYGRLTIAPGIWVAFMGLAEENVILNISDILHDPSESERKDLNCFNYNW